MLKSGMLFILGTAGLLYQFFPFPLAVYLLPILSLVTILMVLPTMSRIPRISSITMLLLGHLIILIEGGTSFEQWSYAFVKTLPVVSLFLFVPLLQIPLEAGGYTEDSRRFAGKMLNKPGRFYWVTAGIYFTLAPLLNLAIHRLYYDIMAKTPLSRKTVAVAMQRTFVATMWSPYFVGVGLISTYLPFKVWEFLLPAFLVGIIQLIIGYFTFKLDIRSETAPEQETVPAAKDGTAGKMVSLVAWIIILMVTIIPLETILQKRMIVIVAVAAIAQSLVWSLAIGAGRRYFKELGPYFRHRAIRSINESMFFLAAGFFAEILSRSYLGGAIAEQVSRLAGYASPYPTMLAIMLIIPLLGLIGIHQMLPIVAIASTVQAHSLGISVNVYAIMLAFTWGATALASPFSPTTITVSSLIDGNPFRVGPVWNARAALIAIVLTSLILYGLQMLYQVF